MKTYPNDVVRSIRTYHLRDGRKSQIIIHSTQSGRIMGYAYDGELDMKSVTYWVTD